MKDDFAVRDYAQSQQTAASVCRGVTAAGRLFGNISTLADIEGRRDPRGDVTECSPFALVRTACDRMAAYYHWCANQGFRSSAVGWPSRLRVRRVRSVTYPCRVVLLRPLWVLSADGGRCRSKHLFFVRIEHFFRGYAQPFVRFIWRFDLTFGPAKTPSDRRCGLSGVFTAKDTRP